VYPNYKHPTVVKFFGADKLKTDSFRASIKDHKQVRVKAVAHDNQVLLRAIIEERGRKELLTHLGCTK